MSYLPRFRVTASRNACAQSGGDVYALLAVRLRHGQILGLHAGVHQVVVPIAIALQLLGSRVLGRKETLVPCGVDDLVARKLLLSQPDPFLQEVMELGEAKPAQLPLVVVVVLCVREERAVVEDAQPADRSVLPHADLSLFFHSESANSMGRLGIEPRT